MRNTFNIRSVSSESTTSQPDLIDDKLLEGFKDLKGTRAVSAVKHARIHCYDQGDLKDYGWGCAGRSLMVTLSSMGLEDESIQSIFNRYRLDKDLHLKLATQLKPELFAHDNPHKSDNLPSPRRFQAFI